jgi:hypothetical protein
MNLETRLSKLEQKLAPTGKTYTVFAEDDETSEQAIARAGIDATPEDMVICISFVDP